MMAILQLQLSWVKVAAVLRAKDILLYARIYVGDRLRHPRIECLDVQVRATVYEEGSASAKIPLAIQVAVEQTHTRLSSSCPLSQTKTLKKLFPQRRHHD